MSVRRWTPPSGSKRSLSAADNQSWDKACCSKGLLDRAPSWAVLRGSYEAGWVGEVGRSGVVVDETEAELRELQPQLKAATFTNDLKCEMVQRLKRKYTAGPICPFFGLV